MSPPRPRPSRPRPYDIVLLGATGFVGRLTADYLARHTPRDVTWAVAGRNRETLTALRDDLATTLAVQGTIDVLDADVTDAESLRRLAESARVVVSTVGPYVLYGDAVVAACAAAGTDYLDLTGEPEFVDTCFVRHHRTALETGARIIHAAGFDSVPHDLGAYFTVLQLPADAAVRVSGYVRADASFSGGTFFSAVTAMTRMRHGVAAARDRKALESHTDAVRARAVVGRPHRDPVDERWALPLPTLDPQVVVRSAGAVPRYGPDFRYSHYASVGHLYTAAGAVVGLATVAGLAQLPPARRVLLDRLKPGDGPSEQRRARSWFAVTFVGQGGGERVVTRVSGGDPGYDETAKMLGEAALCLAVDRLPATAGQVTTVAAMGDALLDRLQKAGIRFEVLSA